jgi:hypothetical protein
MNASEPAVAVPTVIGTPFGGGRYVGKYFVGEQAYALILSPKAEGEHDETKWGGLKEVKGALSYNDGLANTRAMAEAGSALAKWALALRIGDYDDWHIPSRLESLVMFGETKGTDAFDLELDWYWTSTQSASHSGYAWYQGFYGGYQYDNHKSDELRARAVRSIPI